MIKQLLNSVIAKYRDLSVSRRSIICRSRRLRQIIDLLATDKSRYFAQPRPIIANCLSKGYNYKSFFKMLIALTHVNHWRMAGKTDFPGRSGSEPARKLLMPHQGFKY